MDLPIHNADFHFPLQFIFDYGLIASTSLNLEVKKIMLYRTFCFPLQNDIFRQLHPLTKKSSTVS